ncbi:MAG: hypothetical protein ACHP65_05605 [Legionellales bacterium]
MDYNRNYVLLTLFLLSTAAYTAPPDELSNFWQCVTLDADNKAWSAKKEYQKSALNIAFAACKKESRVPSTCKTSQSNCEAFNKGRSTSAMWQCTALDQNAMTWQSNYYSLRDNAALGAKAFCNEKSTVPDTCSINLLACVNANDGAHV